MAAPSVVVPESSSPSGGASEGTTSRRPRKGPSQGTLGAIVVVVVAVVVVLVLLMAGIIPGLRSTGSQSNLTMSEQAAAPLGEGYAGGVAGGPWSLFTTWGTDTTVGLTLPVSNFRNNASCPLQGSTVTSVSDPAYSGDYSNGLAEDWIMVFLSAGGTTAELILFVQNGAVSEIGEETAPGCVPTPSSTALPNQAYDSVAAANAATGTSNASAYLAAHPTSNATSTLYMAPFGPHGAYVPFWDIDYWTCSGVDEVEVDTSLYASNNTVHFSDYYPSSPSTGCQGP